MNFFKAIKRWFSSSGTNVNESQVSLTIDRKITIPPSGQIVLAYAGMLPHLNTVVHGGRVKLAHLGEVYPEQANSFNILYLVSSSLPSDAEQWINACKEYGAKVVWNQNGVGYPAWAGNNYEAVNVPMRRLIHQADWVVYQSKFCKISADKFLGEFQGPCSIVYNCVDTSAFTPATDNLPDSTIHMLVMGSHNQSYRVTVPVEVLALLLKRGIKAKLTIGGRFGWADSAEVEISEKIKSLGLEEHVEIFGPYLQEQAPELYRSAHILIHPKYNDACPTVPIEAMSCGVPVVGSESGGVPELLGDCGGIAISAPQSWDTVHVSNPEEIADAVVLIMEDHQRWSGLARQRAVENFSKEKWLAEHNTVFHSLLDIDKWSD